MKMQFGNTWWGKAWLSALEEVDYSNRLPRGATYAREGLVRKLTIDEEGRINANVIGNYRYRVGLLLPKFFEKNFEHFLSLLDARPSLVLQMANGVLPEAVLALAEEAGLRLFPRSYRDLVMLCTCPDDAVPCKHIAAVAYQVAHMIDNDPFIVFRLHGADLKAALAARGVKVETKAEIPFIRDLWNIHEEFLGERSALPDPEAPLPDLTGIEGHFDSMLKVLPKEPAFYPFGDFRALYEKQMRRIMKEAGKIEARCEKGPCFRKPDEEALFTLDPQEGLRAYMTAELDEWVMVRGTWDMAPYTELLEELLHFPELPAEEIAPSVRGMREALLLAIRLLEKGNVVPRLVKGKRGRAGIVWEAAELDAGTKACLARIEAWVPKDTLQFDAVLGKDTKIFYVPDTGKRLVSIFLGFLIRALAPSAGTPNWCIDAFWRYPWIREKDVQPGGLEGLAHWLAYRDIAAAPYRPQLVLSEEGEEFALEAALIEKETGTVIPFSALWKDGAYQKTRYEMLRHAALLSEFLPQITDYIDDKGEVPIYFAEEDLPDFLFRLLPAVRSLGVEVVLPRSLRRILRPRAAVSVNASAEKKTSFFSLSDLLEFDWKIALGDELVTPEEFAALAGKAQGLIRFKGKYIYVGEGDLLRRRKRLAEARQGKSALLAEAMAGDSGEDAVVMSDAARALLREWKEPPETDIPATICAELRPYQKRGVSWMYNNARLGFGSILADDMGLGKTLQTIALLEKFRLDGLLKKGKVLVAAPAGLLTNWQAEIERFAPQLTAAIYHGTARDISALTEDVILTSYGTLRADADLLKKKKWQVLVIDEAQNIKNPAAGQTKAVKLIPAKIRIALSGTPVENSLGEFWSIMDFTNKGYLSSQKNFSKVYAGPITNDHDEKARERFLRITAPMILRRLKTDKNVISDLPEKIEQNEYAALTPEQTALYEKTVEEAMHLIEGIEETDRSSLFKKKGLILQMILALKEICNHPAQFLKNGDWAPERSGKAALLTALVHALHENREKALIFTQFRETGTHLAELIRGATGEMPPFLHGGCSLAQRSEMVDAFQNDRRCRFLILSLKAAGTGLNLTAATHVIHYDLWWNPAAEAQATDRAYRIGQKKNVFVHRFITKGTFEEKIDEMLRQKKELADLTVSTGESWIGDLSDEDLSRIFRGK